MGENSVALLCPAITGDFGLAANAVADMMISGTRRTKTMKIRQILAPMMIATVLCRRFAEPMRPTWLCLIGLIVAAALDFGPGCIKESRRV